jgi:hypothetical protein
VKGLGTFVAEKGKPLGCGCLCLRVRRVAEEDYTRGRGCDLRAAALFGLTRRGLLATLSSTVTHLNAERHNTRPADADPPAIWGRLQSLRRWMTAAHTRNAALHESGSGPSRRFRVVPDFRCLPMRKAYPVDSGSATCCGLNDRIRSVAGTTIDGQRAFAFAISGTVF